MRSTWTSTRRLALPAALAAIVAGCGGTATEIKPLPPEEQGLKQFADLYRGHVKKARCPPRSLKEMAIKGQGHPDALAMLKSGQLVVHWGAPLTPEGGSGDAVLAYVKTVPEQGGPVLLQDGRTIRTMTADEFKAAPQAGGP